MHDITENMNCIIHCPWNIRMSILIEENNMFLVDEMRVCTLLHDGCANIKNNIPTPLNNSTCI